MANLDVFCAGLSCYDLTFYLDKDPQEDEKTTATSYHESLGGPALVAAGTVAKLGGKCALSSYLGNDSFGERIHELLIKEKVNTHDILWVHQPTPIASIYVKPNGMRSVVNNKGTEPNAPLSSLENSIKSSSIILIDPHWRKLATSTIELAKKHSIPTILDAGTLTDSCLSLAKAVDYCVCSETFASALAKSENQDQINACLKHEFKAGIVTRGAKPIFAWKKSEEFELSPNPIKAVDTTGSGDVFHGALAYSLAKNNTFKNAATFALAAATASCLKRGSFTGIPSLNEIKKTFTY